MAFNRIQDALPAPTAAANRIAEFAPEAAAPAVVPTGFIAVFLPAFVPALVAWQQQIYRAAYAQAVAAHTPRWLRDDWFSAN